MREIFLALMAAALLGGVVLPTSGETIYLYADFNDQPLDQPIGTGGPELGQPIEVDPFISTAVREDPMGSASLEIRDADDYSAGSVCFELLDGAELSSGRVVIAADLWFQALADGYSFFFGVREHGGNAQTFASLNFVYEGSITLRDKQGPAGMIGRYEIGRRTHLVLDYDLDAGTYSVMVDGSVLVADRAHGVTGRGIGRLLIGCNNDSDLDGVFNVDLITVTDTIREVAAATTTWGKVRASFGRR
ncbi:MAG: hypothetical protein ACE15D_03390 [Candidatus Eisenbacteria bacterium]|nr:hypothetical protein [Candidatus Eisenbacteria bacterium]